MAISPVLPVLLACGTAALACDITGWPSSTRHPVPPKAVAPSEVAVTYAMDAPPGHDAVRAARAAVATALGDGAAAATRGADGTSLVIWLGGGVGDWPALDDAVRSVVPGARRGDVRLAICLPGPEPPPDLERDLRRLPGAALARVFIADDQVALTFPPEAPPGPMLVWRIRRLLAPAGKD